MHNIQLVIGLLNFIGRLLAFAVQHPIAALVFGFLSFFLISGFIQGFAAIARQLWIWILNQLGLASTWLFHLIWNALQKGFQHLWNRRKKPNPLHQIN